MWLRLLEILYRLNGMFFSLRFSPDVFLSVPHSMKRIF
jgi:hypothetical protein